MYAQLCKSDDNLWNVRRGDVLAGFPDKVALLVFAKLKLMSI